MNQNMMTIMISLRNTKPVNGQTHEMNDFTDENDSRSAGCNSALSGEVLLGNVCLQIIFNNMNNMSGKISISNKLSKCLCSIPGFRISPDVYFNYSVSYPDTFSVPENAPRMLSDPGSAHVSLCRFGLVTVHLQ